LTVLALQTAVELVSPDELTRQKAERVRTEQVGEPQSANLNPPKPLGPLPWNDRLTAEASIGPNAEDERAAGIEGAGS
jgi:hypothetical protein